MDASAWTELARQALAPRRARLIDALQTLTGAARDDCEDAAQHGDPLRRLMARAVGAARGRWGGHVDPREAWEALAPPGWLDDPRRGFVANDLTRDRSPCPATLGDALAFASDPEGMRAAEELAEEFLLGLARPTGAGVTWCAVVPRRWRAAIGRDAPWSAWVDDRDPSRVEEAETAARLVREGAAPRVGGCAWDLAAVVRAELLARDATSARALAALRGVWSLGYALDRVGDGGCVLVAPRL